MNSPSTDMQQWRADILNAILMFTSVLGVLTAIPSISLAIHESIWAIVFADVVAIAWLLCLWRLKKLSFLFRVWNLLTLVYLLGIVFLFYFGPVGQIYIMAFPILAAILLGLRPAVYALIVNAFTLFSLGYFFNLSMALIGLDDQPLLRWFLITLNFTFISTVITVSCSVLLHRLERSLMQQNIAALSLQKANEELRLIFAAVAQLNDIVMIAEAIKDEPDGSHAGESIIVFVNQAFERRTGYSSAEVVGRTTRSLYLNESQTLEREAILRSLEVQQWSRNELIHYTKDGQQFWLEEDIQVLNDSTGVRTHFVAVGRDITERKKAESDIHRLAYFDVLTGLPNRRLLLDRIDVLIASSQRNPKENVSAILFIDLDHFKTINDARGHIVGDMLLSHVAGRLQSVLRDADTVARIGGDEFVVLLVNLADDVLQASAKALLVAEKISHAISERFVIEQQHYHLSCSIGISLLFKEGLNTADLLREADIAMYRAKAAGRKQIVFFEEHMQIEVEQRLLLERDLAAAIELNQLHIAMQLQVDAHTKPVGAELLLRWTHPMRGSVSPASFIPLAESSGYIFQIGNWVLQQACQILLVLEQQGYDFPISVNVSPKQFHQEDFVAHLIGLLKHSGAPAQRLILEVTEGLFIDNLQETVARMHQLCELGVRFSIDDFGTGYSSLSYLQRLPIYELKIDKSFVDDTPGDPNATAIVSSILAMAQHLNLKVVAEGVETQQQADYLIASGCAAMQGYLFARPVPFMQCIEALGRYADHV